MKNKYKITFYKFYGVRFNKIYDGTWYCAFKFALKTAFKQSAVFKIQRINLIKL